MKNETNGVNKLNVKTCDNNVIINFNYFSNLILYEIRNIDIRLCLNKQEATMPHENSDEKDLIDSLQWNIYTVSSFETTFLASLP